MKNIVKAIFVVSGILLIVDAVFMALVSNYNSGILLVILLGAVLLCYGIFRDKIINRSKKGVLSLIRKLFYVGILYIIILITFLSAFGNADNVTYNEDVVIVLGAGLRGEKITYPLYYRLAAAVSYYNKNPNAKIIVTGGQGSGETVSEAYAMEKFLLQNNIPKSSIIKEEKATSTYENLKYTKKILDEMQIDDYDTVIITNEFHIYRAVKLAEKCSISANHLHGKINWYSIPVNYIRECVAVSRLWILGY